MAVDASLHRLVCATKGKAVALKFDLLLHSLSHNKPE